MFFCLICNAILPLLEKETHHESEKHLELFDKAKAEGTSIRNKKVPAIDTNSNVAASPIQPNNNSVKTPTSKADSQIPDSKKANESRPKAQENKAQNGSALDINDNRTTSSTNTKESATITTGNGSEKAFEQTKSDSQNNKTQNAPNVTNVTHSNLVPKHEIKFDFQIENGPKHTINTETETAFLFKGNSQISQEAQSKHTQELKDKSKPIAKDAEKKNSEATKVKVEAGKVPKAKVNNEVNGTARNQTDKAEPYLYEFLKARNFIIKAHDGASYCTICDINIIDTDVHLHHRDEHHKILYSKHVARKTKLSDLDSVSTPSETHGELKANKPKAATDKENVAPENGQNTKNATSETNAKLIEAKGKTAAKESKDTSANTPLKCGCVVPLTNEKEKPTVANSGTTGKTELPAIEQPSNKENNSKQSSSENKTKHQKQTDKENSAPENYNNILLNRSRSNERNKGDTKQEPTETAAQNKKAAKKNQKKAAKAKVSETDIVLPKEVQANETAEAFEQSTSKTAIVERGDRKESTSELIIGDSTHLVAGDPKKELEKGQDCEQKDEENEAMAFRFPSEAEIKTEKLLSLLKTVSHIDSASDVVVNSKHVLGNLSFVLVLRSAEKAECVACCENFDVSDINMHVTTDSHREHVEDCPVVTSLGDEFIRQVTFFLNNEILVMW